MRILPWLIMLAFCVGLPAHGTGGYAVYDPLTGDITGEKTGTRGRIASTTKLMTALVAVERADLCREVEILPAYVAVEGSKMYLQAGERRTVEELLYGLLLASGNDAALALAGGIGGEEGRFVGWMNQTAAKLGMKNSCFENPTGLDGKEHGASPEDLAILMTAVLENEVLGEILATRYKSFAGYTLKNHNRLLWLSEECIGGKTGYTRAAGRCLVSAFERFGRQVVVVTLDTPEDWERHLSLAGSFFSDLKMVKGKAVLSLPVVNGWEGEATLSVVYALPLKEGEAEDLSFRLYAPHFLYEMPPMGKVVGRVEILLGSRVIGEADAVALGRQKVQ